MTRFTIRTERPSDETSVYDLTKCAFEPMPYPAGDEQDLFPALRAAGAPSLSLVAENVDRIVGDVAFSPMTPLGWFALGPVSTAPDFQKQGIGAVLILAGLAQVEARGAKGCALTGNPAYYSRFGFALDPPPCPAQEPARYFMTLTLLGPRPDMPFAFHPLFYQSPDQKSGRKA